MEVTIWILTLFGLQLVLSFAGIGLYYVLFKKLSAASYFFGGVLIWVLSALFSFTLAFFWKNEVVEMVMFSSFILLGLWLLWSRKKSIFSGFDWKIFLIIQATSFLSMMLMLIIRSYNPAILGGDRPMEIGILGSLDRASKLPLQNFWLSGETLNYYYFGHYMLYIVGLVTNIPFLDGYVVYSAWLYGVFAAAVTALVFAIIEFIGLKRYAVTAALISIFFTLVGSTVFALFLYVTHLGTFDIINNPGWLAHHANFFYAGAESFSTVLVSPLFSYIQSDLHASSFSYIVVGLVLSLMLHKETGDSFLGIIIVHLALAAVFLTNPWSVTTVAPLYLLFVGQILYHSRNKGVIAGTVVLSVIAALILVLPWYSSFNTPVGGVGISSLPKNPFVWLAAFGFPMGVVIYTIFKLYKNKHLDGYATATLVTISLSVIGSVLFAEFFYIKDYFSGSSREVFNTIFKTYTNTQFLVGILFGPFLLYMVQRSNKAVRYTSIVIAIVMLSAQLFHTYLGLTGWFFKTGAQQPVSNTTTWVDKDHPGDLDAILYMREHIKGNATIVEAEGESYTAASIYSSYTGLNAVSGYPEHVWSWNGDQQEVYDRVWEVREFYTGTDVRAKRDFLDKYKVQYIVLGGFEKKRYGALLQEELITSLVPTVLYMSDTVKILEVR